MAIVAIVPSREMHKIQPRNGPASSPWNCTTLKRGVVNMAQRAASSKELYIQADRWTKSSSIWQSKGYLMDQNAIEPSSAPPTTYFSRVRGFWTTWRPPIDPFRDGSDVFSADDVSKAKLSDFVAIWATENWRIRPSAERDKELIQESGKSYITHNIPGWSNLVLKVKQR